MTIAVDLIRPEKPVLVLRVCKANLSSSHNFIWPKEGIVKAADWTATAECGHGLHGWLWGAGDSSVTNYLGLSDAKWLVVEVDEYIDLGGKVKFPKGRVVFCGDRHDATAYLASFAPPGTPIIGGTATAGDHGTATAGGAGTATAGDAGTATAGDHGTATAGDHGTATAGDHGTARAGYAGTATAGYRGTATAGDHGTATAGYAGTATAGYAGTATAGDDGTARAGNDGSLAILYWDVKKARYRKATAKVGENGIELNTPYRYTVSDGWVKA